MEISGCELINRSSHGAQMLCVISVGSGAPPPSNTSPHHAHCLTIMTFLTDAF